jgi:hypothetical protein
MRKSRRSGTQLDNAMLPINLKAPMIVVLKPIYQRFISGEKTVEYRRHRAPFTEGVFYVGRIARLAYNYNLKRYPSRLAKVEAFEIARVGDPILDGIDLASHYGELAPGTEIAMIRLRLLPPE